MNTMITTINAKQLKELNVCAAGYKTFIEVHGYETVNLSEALISNGINDLFWLLAKIDLSTEQEKDLRLLACDYAEDVLRIFEEEYPDDKRPRAGIVAARKFARGEIDQEEVDAAYAADYAASFYASYYVTAWAAATAAARDNQTARLMSVLINWENKQ